jgi:hypothetical protein
MGHLFKIKHPEIFQGRLTNKHYFEGWYFKLVDASSQTLYAFIIGISLDKKTNTSHAFVQFFNVAELKMYYLKYDVSEFHASDDKLEIQIGPNLFTLDKIHVDIDRDGQNIQGDLTFTNIIRYPNPSIGYGIMGPASYIPHLECRHGLISLSHAIHGTLSVNGESHDFEGGKGYLEKDWGTSFPYAYSWMQVNHFNKEGISLVGSIAKVPLFGLKADAFFVVLLYDGKVYRFSNYDFSKMQIYELEDNYIHYSVSNNKFEIDIKGTKTNGIDLISPSQGSMQSTISESLTSKLDIAFYSKKGNQKTVIYEGTGDPAGLEIQANKKYFKVIPEKKN